MEVGNMSYKYEQSVPFERKRYIKLKDGNFTDEIRIKMDDFFQYIDSLCKEDYMNTKGKLDKDKLSILIEDLSVKYQQFRNQYIRPVVEKQYKYKELAYTQEEVDFIFNCSYCLIDKFNLSQRMLAKIFNIRENKFSKLGCFPVRCHDAYTKLDDISNRKCLVPNNTNSIGIQIAECINKKVQAVYACPAFVGVSNDLDTLVNISTTDRKVFILTKSNDVDNVLENVLSYPRFLFASSNNFENIIGEYKAGKIKEKIINLLKMRDDSILVHSNYLLEILKSGDEYRKYCKDTQSGVFRNNLIKYRGQLELLDRIENDDFYVDDIIYETEYRKSVGIDISDINFELKDIDVLYSYLKESSQKTYERLLNSMSYAGVSHFDEILFKDYQMCMQMTLVECYMRCLEDQNEFEKFFDENEKIRLAAIFWILEVCGSESMTQQKYDNILKYLKSKSFLSYIDAVNKEVKKGKKPHLYYEDESFEIGRVIDDVVGVEKVDSSPVLLYIDSESYKIEIGYVDSLVKENNILLIIRDKKGLINKWGMKLLDEQLSLYMKESQYANI